MSIWPVASKSTWRLYTRIFRKTNCIVHSEKIRKILVKYLEARKLLLKLARLCFWSSDMHSRHKGMVTLRSLYVVIGESNLWGAWGLVCRYGILGGHLVLPLFWGGSMGGLGLWDRRPGFNEAFTPFQ